MTTLRELLQKFRPPEIIEAEILLAHLLKKERPFIISHGEKKITKRTAQHFARLIQRKNRGEPLAYLLGQQPFYGLNFIVNRRVLIPRPESEWLVEKSIEILRQRRDINTIIDVGTGSGCIIISLLKNLTPARQRRMTAYATDISPAALTVAKRNAKTHNITKIKFLHGNLLKPTNYLPADATHQALQAGKLPMLRSATQGKQAASSPVLLLANLPYLSTKDYNRAPLSVRRFEPEQALLAGHDGLKYYRALVKAMARHPQTTFYCLWEIDPHHAKQLAQLVKKYCSPAQARIKKDLRGLNRYLSITIPK